MDDYHLTPDERKQVNDELRKYGTLEDELFGRWEWFQLNEKGMAFVESVGFEEKGKKENEHKEDRRMRIVGMIIAVLTFLLTFSQFVKGCTQSDQEDIQPVENWLI